MQQNNVHQQLIDDIGSFVHDPVGFAAYAYDWGNGSLEGFTGPKKWQKRILQDIKDHLSNPDTRHTPLQISTASGHSIGKSALLSMVCGWGLSTHEDCRIVVTANTDSQLRTKTWPEMTKWMKLAINSDWFTTTATAVISADKAHQKSWRADATPWSTANTEAFAGLHNKGKRIIIIFDEASAIDDKVWEVTDGVLTDDNTEIIWLAFGNPTRKDGRFYECFNKFRHRWKNYQIDARTVEGTNKEQLDKMVADYGEDSDYVKVRIRGIFPSTSCDHIMGREAVDNCFKYAAIEYDWSAKVFGVDFARFGSNQNVVAIRQGRKVFPLEKWYGLDGMQTASRVVALYNREKPDALFLDDGGLGGPIIDRIKQLIPKEKVFAVNFNNTSSEPKRFHNKRAEMWWKLGEAVNSQLDLEQDEELAADLVAVPYFFDGDQRIQLPKKEDMETSPDCGDALALTFAENVVRDKPVHTVPRVHRNIGGWRG
jgi:hypothetical protein